MLCKNGFVRGYRDRTFFDSKKTYLTKIVICVRFTTRTVLTGLWAYGTLLDYHEPGRLYHENLFYWPVLERLQFDTWWALSGLMEGSVGPPMLFLRLSNHCVPERTTWRCNYRGFWERQFVRDRSYRVLWLGFGRNLSLPSYLNGRPEEKLLRMLVVGAEWWQMPEIAGVGRNYSHFVTSTDYL